ncbi:MAG: hypothetical protein ACRDRN_24860 [Sciscionella sp.]
MTETRIPDVTDALIALWTSVFTNVEVADGPVVSGTIEDQLYIGFDSDPDTTGHAATSAQQWAGLGQRKRDEQIDVVCSVLARSTDDTAKTARDRAFTILNTAGQALRGNPSLSLSSPCVAGLTVGDLFYHETTAGTYARLVFTVHVNTRV